MDSSQVKTIRVLNNGHVRLVKWTGDDLDIVRAARVSYDAVWRAGKDDKSDEKLIRYLTTHRHTSPFEHVVLTFDIQAPIFVLRQWHRHRTWSYSEVSARYSELDLGFFEPAIEAIGGQSTNNKQGRDTNDLQFNPVAVQSLIRDHNNVCYSRYRALLEQGVARELARLVLPVTAYSQMFATVDLHNFFHFVGLRSHSHAQAEIRAYSNAMLQLVSKYVAPVAAREFINANWLEGDEPVLEFIEG